MTITANEGNEMQKIPEWFLRTEIGKKMAVEAQASTLSSRQDLVAQIDKAKAAIDSAVPGLMANLEKAAMRMERARETFESAKAAHAQAHFARYVALSQFESEIQQAESKLRESSDPRISQTINDLRDEIETIRLNFVSFRKEGYDPAAEQVRLRGLVAEVEAMLVRADRDCPQRLVAIRQSAGLLPLPEEIAV